MRMHVSSMADAYTEVCRRVVRTGRSVSPRGQETLEIADAVIICDDPTDSLPRACGRNLNPALGVAEALQLIGGLTLPDLMTAISPNFAQFLDDGKFHGAYGPRVAPQLQDVVNKLNEDKHTRQAIVTIWDPALDNERGLHDYPCTLSLTFCIRDDRLELHVTMRSNDVWWGLAYDAFQFTQLQCTIANVMGIAPGKYYHHAVSLHAYARDFDKIEALYDRVITLGPLQNGVSGQHGLALPATYRAQAILTNLTTGLELSTYEEWMRDKLAPYWKKIHDGKA